MTRLAQVFIVFVLSIVAAGAAEGITINNSELIVEYTTGAGDNATYFVVDFGGAPSGDMNSYAFEYRWNPGEQIIAATALADTGAPPGAICPWTAMEIPSAWKVANSTVP